MLFRLSRRSSPLLIPLRNYFHSGWRSSHNDSAVFRVSEEVRQAVAERRPTVALESAIYTHGFPYPDNIALASLLESIVRTNGGVPATIGVLDGIAKVGLDTEEIIRLAGSVGKDTTRKVSRRDLAFMCGLGTPGRRFHGGTTIAGTMILAHMAGIKIFATGGLGGVHRGGESSMDVSADLTELGRTPVAVISSGCKSFLDIPRTLEYLETQGVPVATFADGRSGDVDFPGFWTRDSGSRSPMTVRDEAEAAAIVHAQNQLRIQTGLVISNPIAEEDSISKEVMDRAIAEAVQDAERAGVFGSANTPYILAKIKDLTGDQSVNTNRALIAANAKCATRVAVELKKLEASSERVYPPWPPSSHVMDGPGAANYTPNGISRGITQPDMAKDRPGKMSTETKFLAGESIRRAATEPNDRNHLSVFVAGSLAIDLACDHRPFQGALSSQPQMHTSNPATITQTIGGVGHNVTRAIHLLGARVRLCTLVGDDAAGFAAKRALVDSGLDVHGIQVIEGERTPQYVAINDGGKNLVLAMADMAILDNESTAPQSPDSEYELAFSQHWLPQLRRHRPSHVVLDANWGPSYLRKWITASQAIGARVAYEPVSVAKSSGIFHMPKDETLDVYPNSSLNIATPNSYELQQMHTIARETGSFDREDWWHVIDALGLPSSGARKQLSLATSPALVDSGIPQQSIQLLPFIPQILTKLGAEGVLLTQIIPAGDSRLSDGDYAPYIISRCNNGSGATTKVGGLYMRLFPPVEVVPEQDVVSVNGVGDTMMGAIVAGLAQQKERHVESLVDLAQRAAVMTLKSRESVSPGLGNLKLAGL